MFRQYKYADKTSASTCSISINLFKLQRVFDINASAFAPQPSGKVVFEMF